MPTITKKAIRGLRAALPRQEQWPPADPGRTAVHL